MTAQERFVALRSAHHTAVLGYALRRTDSYDDAVDAVAEVFLIAWRRLGDVPAGDGALPWLYGTARRVLANHHRGARRRRQLGQRLRQHLPATLDRDEESSDLIAFDAVAGAFKSLRDADREVLALVGWEGLDHRQLGVVLECSPTAARVRLHRARRRFASALASAGIEREHRAGGHDPDDASPRRPSVKEASDA